MLCGMRKGASEDRRRTAALRAAAATLRNGDWTAPAIYHFPFPCQRFPCLLLAFPIAVPPVKIAQLYQHFFCRSSRPTLSHDSALHDFALSTFLSVLRVSAFPPLFPLLVASLLLCASALGSPLSHRLRLCCAGSLRCAF